MSGIFISYRRQDTSGYAGRLYERLSKHFGKQHVFMDIDTLQPGLDFGQALDHAVSSCKVLIALIGPNWLNAVDADGRRRLENPDDFVRMEIAAALARDGVRVVPVLVGNASLPRADALPDDLKPLARRQSVEISDNRWEYDLARLIERLELVVPRARGGVAGVVTSRRAMAVVVPVLLALVALFLRLDLLGNGNGADSASTPTSTAAVQTVPAELSTPDATDAPTLEPTHTPEAGQAAVADSDAATPEISSLLATAGLTSETSYASPQFGYTIAWSDDWKLDPGYNPPVRSDDGADSLYLSVSGAELSFSGSAPGSREAVKQRIATLTSDEYLRATFGDRDHDVLHAEASEGAGVVIVLERLDDAPSLVHLIETSLLEDGETLVSVHLVAEAERIGSVHAMTRETVSLDGGAPLRLLDASDVVAKLEEPQATPQTEDVTTPAPRAESTGAATPAAPSAPAPAATAASTQAPDSTPTVLSTPVATPEPTEASVDSAMQAAGLVSDRRYVSPLYGHAVEWDDTWMLDFDYEAPVVSNAEEQFDAIHITTAELYTPFMRVAAYDGEEWGSMEEVVGRLTSDEWMEMAYPGAEKQVLLQKYSGDRGGMVVSRTTDSGQEYIAIFEAHLVDDGETLLLVTMTTTPNQIESAHARTNETVRINEGPALTVFEVDEIVAAVEVVSESGAVAAADRVALYESPYFDYNLSWDGRWVPNEAMAPAIGYDESTLSDFVNLRASDSSSVLLKVGAVETSGQLDAETAVNSYASESFLSAAFGADHVLLAREVREDSGGIVLLHTTAGSEFITIMESVLLDEGSTMVTLIWTAPLSESDEVVAYLESTRSASLRLNGQPLPGGFDGDAVFEALARQRAQEPQ